MSDNNGLWSEPPEEYKNDRPDAPMPEWFRTLYGQSAADEFAKVTAENPKLSTSVKIDICIENLRFREMGFREPEPNYHSACFVPSDVSRDEQSKELSCPDWLREIYGSAAREEFLSLTDSDPDLTRAEKLDMLVRKYPVVDFSLE